MNKINVSEIISPEEKLSSTTEFRDEPLRPFLTPAPGAELVPCSDRSGVGAAHLCTELTIPYPINNIDF